MHVSEILRFKGSTLYTVTPETSLSECVIVMADQDIGSLVVMDKGRLVGLITFREVIVVLASRQREQRSGPTPPVSELQARDVMNPEPAVATPEMDVNGLRRAMIDSHQRYLPVMDAGTLMGVVSFHDVARVVLEEQSFENRMLKAYIQDRPAEA